MHRLFLGLTAAALAAAPASAASYSAKPAAAPAALRIIAPDIVWKCGPAGCLGSSDYGRPAVICKALAKRAGRLDSFVVDGRAFAAAELERCNASAKALASPALANAR